MASNTDGNRMCLFTQHLESCQPEKVECYFVTALNVTSRDIVDRVPIY